MLTVSVLDANECAGGGGRLASVTAVWLDWEVRRAGLEPVSPDRCDILLAVYPGAVDWTSSVSSALRRLGIDPRAQSRTRPYVVAGGGVDGTPLTALAVANALAVGEGYLFVRGLLDGIRSGWTVADARQWVTEHPHAIEASQVVGLERDAQRPWLLSTHVEPLASPDDYVDWTTPPVRCDDHVVRVQASRGCRGHCAYCATTWRQRFSVNPGERALIATLEKLVRRGERVQLVTNDVADLPYYARLPVSMDSQSYTLRTMRDPVRRAALMARPPKMARFGVEGLSERIRRAFGKPISRVELLQIFDDLQEHHIQSHLFFIPAAPYEAVEDVEEFRSLYRDLARLARVGITRIKCTTFLPTPPAPLARFTQSFALRDPRSDLVRWVARNCASRHIVLVAGSSRAGLARRLAEQLSVPVGLARDLLASDTTVDLAPTLDDYRRLPSELIRWPVPTEVRYAVGTAYQRRMVGDA